MKNNRHGQAAVLEPAQIQKLFGEGLLSDRDKALFGVCLYTACRINEAVSLLAGDVYQGGKVRDEITLRKETTKGQQSTRTVPVCPELRAILEGYHSEKQYLFPGRHGRGHLNPKSASAILSEAFDRVGIDGASTHSFRRTTITHMHNSRVPIKHIQEISGHRTLSALQRYIDVTDEDKKRAIATLSFQ
ncbi:MAG: site-specific integrase [Oculatellaceae cyanobacterium Prado106]|jgi:integrase/recombinase XerD|nr:site-specific integrase [Oculatellaceae cyanobacterium Prado106]